MLEIRGSHHRNPGRGDRRSFLKVGSLGLGGLTLPEVLAARHCQAAVERKDTAVILFWMAGGPSHIDTYDPKPYAPVEVRGPFRPIPTSLDGLQLCELMPRQARIAKHLSVIRSLHHSLSVHDDASHWVQTGYPLLNARARGQTHPAQGAVVSALKGSNRQGIPGYVCIPEAYRTHMGFYQTAAYLGGLHDPLDGGGNPTLGNYRPPEFAIPARLGVDRVRRRRDLLGAVERLRGDAESSGMGLALDQIRQQAFDLVTGSAAREAFDLGREPAASHERYGGHAWGQSALLARRLVEAGVTFVTINLYEKDVDWWDDHTTIEKNLRKRLPVFDHAFATLVEDLRDRGLAERVLVVACGEFGRAPRIDAAAGRAHWPRAMSAVLTGGGIREGQVVGRTTPDGGDPDERPLGPGDLLATIYRVLGVDPTGSLLDRQKRPVPLVESGEPIRELL